MGPPRYQGSVVCEQLCPDHTNKKIKIFNKNDEMGNRCVLEISNASSKDVGWYVARRGGKLTDDELKQCTVFSPRTSPSCINCTWVWVALVLWTLLCMVAPLALWEWKGRQAFFAWRQRKERNIRNPEDTAHVDENGGVERSDVHLTMSIKAPDDQEDDNQSQQ